jgi:RHS repeat-associated protein
VEGAPPVTKSLWPPIGMADSFIFTRGNKLFELTNHLGNVLSTITDKRFGVSTNDSTVTYFIPEVASANDYYPFGSLESNRSYTDSGFAGYRYGFNGKEKDDEVKRMGDQVDYGMRVYDPRVGRFLSLDPLINKYPWYSPYQFAGNKPIWSVDLDGEEEKRSNKGIVLHSGLTILNVLNKKDVYQFNQFKYNHPIGTFNKFDVLKGAKQYSITDNKQFSESLAWVNEFFTNGDVTHEDNPIKSVTESQSFTEVTEIDLGKFGKYIKIETKSTSIDVDINGPAMQNNIKGIKKTTTTRTGYQKVISDNSDGTIDLSFSPKDFSNVIDVSIENIPLSPTYIDNLKKLSPQLAAQVDYDNQVNKEIVTRAIKTINNDLKKVEEKANNGDYIRQK